MRRWTSLVLLLLLLTTGCARKDATPTPTPPAQVDQPVATAPDQSGEMQRVTIKPGQPIELEGLFFMQVATGEVEGWVIPKGSAPAYASDDNRWVAGTTQAAAYLADRKTGAVRKWPAATWVVAARGDVVLLRSEQGFQLSRDAAATFEPVAVAAPEGYRQAVIAPDGRAVILAVDTRLYLIDTKSGKAREIGTLTDYAGLETARQGQEAVVTGGQPLTVRRYSFDGKLLSEQAAPGRVLFAPDGKSAAWHESLLGLAGAINIGTTALKPALRMQGERNCSLPLQGPYWLPDSSGLAVATTQGPRLLGTDGSLKPLGDGKSVSLPVPAPDKPGRFALNGYTVVDATGKVIAAAAPTLKGMSGLYPWGERSDEVRFVVRSGGKGVSCDPDLFPPAVEKAPFAPVTGLEVKVAAGDCVNLRQEYTKESPVITCLPGGARLRAAQPPGINNKGELRRWGNPASLSMGGEFWWFVRTEQGQRGWVYLSAEYFTWARPKAGEPAPDLVAERIADEALNMRFWLGVAAGQTPCGAVTCFPGPSLTDSVQGLITWCKQGPAEIKALAGFAPAKHGAGLTKIESACKALSTAPEPLSESPTWLQRVKDLLITL